LQSPHSPSNTTIARAFPMALAYVRGEENLPAGAGAGAGASEALST
jgi:hypothetical protein